jgi:hypothetical protein
VTWQFPSSNNILVWSDGYFGRPYPASITPPLTHAGAFVAAAKQGNNKVDAFVAGNDGVVHVTRAVGLGHWAAGTPGNPAPALITPPAVMPVGGCLTTAMQSANQLDVLATMARCT